MLRTALCAAAAEARRSVQQELKVRRPQSREACGIGLSTASARARLEAWSDRTFCSTVSSLMSHTQRPRASGRCGGHGRMAAASRERSSPDSTGEDLRA